MCVSKVSFPSRGQSSPRDVAVRLPQGWNDTDTPSTPPFATGDCVLPIAATPSLGTTPPIIPNPSVLNATPPRSLPTSQPLLFLTGSDRRGNAIRLTVSPFKTPPPHSKKPNTEIDVVTPRDDSFIDHRESIASLGFARAENDDLHAELGLLIETMQSAPNTLHMFSNKRESCMALLSELDSIIIRNQSIPHFA